VDVQFAPDVDGISLRDRSQFEANGPGLWLYCVAWPFWGYNGHFWVNWMESWDHGINTIDGTPMNWFDPSHSTRLLLYRLIRLITRWSNREGITDWPKYIYINIFTSEICVFCWFFDQQNVTHFFSGTPDSPLRATCWISMEFLDFGGKAALTYKIYKQWLTRIASNQY
jgi:hypothetical protein